MEVGGVAGGAAQRHHHGVARKRCLELALHGGGNPAAGVGSLARHHHEQLALGAAGRLHAQRARLDQRRERGALHAAGPALGHGEHAGAPVALLGLLRAGAHDHDRGARAQVAAELLGPGHDVVAVGEPAPEEILEEVRHGRFAGALGRLGALDLLADQCGHHAQQARRRRALAGPVAELPDALPRHTKVHRLAACLAGHHHSLVLRGRACHRQDAARAVDHDHAGAQRAAGRARPRPAARRRTPRPRTPGRARRGRWPRGWLGQPQASGVAVVGPDDGQPDGRADA